MLNSPCSLLTLSNWTPVALFLATTLAPGSTPPELSTTVPASDEFATPCANAGDGLPQTSAVSRHTSTDHDARFIEVTPPMVFPDRRPDRRIREHPIFVRRRGRGQEQERNGAEKQNGRAECQLVRSSMRDPRRYAIT